ncbi:Fic family protein [Lonepinella sp. BR2271]|uniref:Fic family protein n=1 Tax=Lonepinella sp. BR2271 TaxID=3434550 RepID=UPI003F6E13AA
MNTKKYQLKKLLDLLNSKRPFNEITAKSIQDHFDLKYNQQSNAIEGNSLTLSETKILLENGITAKGKPFKDHLDIINHQQAIFYLQDVVREKLPLSEKIIREFHYLLLKGSENERYAGVYRTIPVMISGAEHIPPQPYLLPSKMADLVSDYQKNLAVTDDNIALIAKLHADFVAIHPFVDGNGRTGRLLMNFELMKNGYPLAIIPFDSRDDYYQALAQADNGDYLAIEQLIKSAVMSSIIEMLNVVFPDWQAQY